MTSRFVKLLTVADSCTFHGRDVQAFVGARLASGAISDEQVGPVPDSASVLKIAYQQPVRSGDVIRGIIPVLDEKYGNVWTNIPKTCLMHGASRPATCLSRWRSARATSRRNTISLPGRLVN